MVRTRRQGEEHLDGEDIDIQAGGFLLRTKGILYPPFVSGPHLEGHEQVKKDPHVRMYIPTQHIGHL